MCRLLKEWLLKSVNMCTLNKRDDARGRRCADNSSGVAQDSVEFRYCARPDNELFFPSKDYDLGYISV